MTFKPGPLPPISNIISEDMDASDFPNTNNLNNKVSHFAITVSLQFG